MKLFIMYLSSCSCYLLLLMPKYFPEYPVFTLYICTYLFLRACSVSKKISVSMNVLLLEWCQPNIEVDSIIFDDCSYL